MEKNNDLNKIDDEIIYEFLKDKSLEDNKNKKRLLKIPLNPKVSQNDGEMRNGKR